MTKLLFGSVALIVMSVAAWAADMPVKAPVLKAPPPAPIYSWTGCYIGGNIGGGGSRIDVTRVRTPGGFAVNENYGSADGRGWLGGGQIGCDLQTGAIVFGVQGMFDWSRIKSDHTIPITFLPPFTTFTYHTDIRRIFTLTGRVGFAMQPAALIYVKGGGAWKRENLQVRGVVPITFLSETADNVEFRGWTIGGGFEYGFAPNWSLFVEGNYLDFGTKRIAFIAAPGTIGAGTVGDIVDQTQRVTTILGGINVRFGGAPVVARY